MDTDLSNEKYRKLSVTSLAAGILAISFCITYFLAWMLFDSILVNLISEFGFISYIQFLFVCSGAVLTIAAVVTGSIDFKRIKAGIYSRKGKGFDIAGIILGSFLILFGFTLWFIDFFGIVNILS